MSFSKIHNGEILRSSREVHLCSGKFDYLYLNPLGNFGKIEAFPVHSPLLVIGCRTPCSVTPPCPITILTQMCFDSSDLETKRALWACTPCHEERFIKINE